MLIHKIWVKVNFILTQLTRLYYKYVKNTFYNCILNTKNNHFTCKGILIKSKIRVFGDNNSIVIEEGVVLRNTNITIRGSNNHLIIHSNACISEKGRIRIEDYNNKLEIGENTLIIGAFFSIADSNTEIIVGKNCLFSANVILRTSDSHSICDLNGQRLNHGKSIFVNDHVWIGYGVTLLKGSIIGRDSVVGTNSVVTGLCVPDNAVAAGFPAKIIRNNISWNINRI